MSAKKVGNQSRHQTRIGIYSGAFNPVHSGHIAFALQSMLAADLDEIIFMPERRPRNKPGVEHYAHRIAMLHKALAPHPGLSVIEMVDRNYSVHRTLPQLRGVFPDAKLVFLMGSDAVLTVPSWPWAERLLQTCELVVGVRSEHQGTRIAGIIDDWDVAPSKLTILDSFAPDVSSARIRHALQANQYTKGLLTSVSRYARQEWLYVSPGNIVG